MKRVPEEAPLSDSVVTVRSSESPNTSLGVQNGSLDSSFSNTKDIGGASFSSTIDQAEILGTSTASTKEFGGGRFGSSYSRPGNGHSYTQNSTQNSKYSTNTTATNSYDPCEQNNTSLSVHPSESHRSSYYDENLPPTPANVEKRFIQRVSQSSRASQSSQVSHSHTFPMHSRSRNPTVELPPCPVPIDAQAIKYGPSQSSGKLSWLRSFQQFMTWGRRIGVSLLLSSLDRVSDITVAVVWLSEGHTLWSIILLTIFAAAGSVQVSVLYHDQKVRGARLILNFLGLGIYAEGLRFLYLSYYDDESRRMRERRLKIRQTKSFSQKQVRPLLRFVVIRAIETFCKTLPAGALQLYIAVLSPSNFNSINVISILASIIG